MAHKHHYGMSELEQEFELEMDERSYSDTEQFPEAEMEYESEYDEDSTEGEYEYEEDAPESEYEYDEDTSESEYEYEEDTPESEYEYDEDTTEQEYEYEEDMGEGADMPPWAAGERFFELAQYEFESEYELDNALGGILEEMEREYFLKGLLKNPLVNIAAGFIPGGSTALGLAKGVSKISDQFPKNLKKKLGGLAKTGIRSLTPGATGMASRFAKRLGLHPETTEQAARNAFQKIENGIQRSFEYAAHYFGDHVADPEEADRLVHRAFEAGMQAMTQPTTITQPQKSFQKRGKDGVRTVSLQERPGEEIRKIVIVIDKRR